MSTKSSPQQSKRIFEKSWGRWTPDEILSFSSFNEECEMPDLLEIQKKSFVDFLQKDLLPEERKNEGLEEVLSELFPIVDKNDRGRIEYLGYVIGSPKYTIQECIDRGITYAVPIKILLRLVTFGRVKDKQAKTMKAQEVYLGDFPVMTEKGTFIVNGAERVIVSQLHRSPGIAFREEDHPNGKSKIFSARMIPFRGSWLEFQTDIHDSIIVIIDNKKKTKMPLTTFMRCFGIKQAESLLDSFFDPEEVSLAGMDVDDIDGFYLSVFGSDHYTNYFLARPVIDEETGEIPSYFVGNEEYFADTGSQITIELLAKLAKKGVSDVQVYKIAEKLGHHRIWNTFDNDINKTVRLSLLFFGSKIRPGSPINVTSAQTLFSNMFLDPQYYDLKDVGKFKIEKKFDIEVDNPKRVLSLDYVVAAIKYLCGVSCSTADVDDIDHLGNRRVRPVGELLQNQIRMSMVEIRRNAEEKMVAVDQFQSSKILPSLFISTKIFNQYIQDFFGRAQLSQFMDQTNPLAALTNKRRLSALGPGGLTRERAGFEVRDVHYTHYGRVCPIETPEGQNIGLISSLTTYARINPYGFVETPYRRVIEGKLSDQVDYLTADEEENFYIAQANAKINEKGEFTDDMVFARIGPDFGRYPLTSIQYIDVSPKQMVSISTSLIPFLEHDDANRALMGSNMQRQAVPLLFPEQAIVCTGIEEKVARDCGASITAVRGGVVKKVDAKEIVIEEQEDDNVFQESYQLRKFNRSNQNTCINHRPIVEVGDTIKKGQVIADGPSCSQGKLALGRNALVAFMPWKGYNYEDAILLSERLVRDDVYTSIYIEELSVEALQMGKLGDEEITREIKGVEEDLLDKLTDNGIIRIGTRVKPGDILVGKVTPKGEDDLTAEEKLLRAIFGEKARDVKNTSLMVPSGLYGTVIDVKVFKRKHSTDRITLEEQDQIAKLHREKEVRENNLNSELDSHVRKLVRSFEADVIDNRTGEVLYRHGARKIKTAADAIKDALKDDILIVDGDIGTKIKREYSMYRKRRSDLEDEYNEKEKRIREGEELPPGVNCLVKVYIAEKRKIKVGDKMAGRHGNKGVISRILPIEDMPYLEDGTPVDVVLNPLGVPSRMNVGQILETHLGWAAAALGLQAETPVFDGASEQNVKDLLEKAGLPTSGQITLRDGLSGEAFDNPVTVGQMYMLKLYHMVEDKIHARSIGPYALVTQQPLGGRSQYGGQRIGEMEVWAFEGYGAAYTLQELLTIKSDDVQGRTKIYESIFKGKVPPRPGIPESFNVLVKELQALGIDLDFLETKSIDQKDEIGLMIMNESYNLASDLEEESEDVLDSLISQKNLTEKEELLQLISETSDEE